jgi:uncharacterized protein (DUF433 family)
MTFTRITIDPAVCTGKPCIRGLRFPVARLLGLRAAGETREQILNAYPYLENGDIDEALRYAAFLAKDETIEFAPDNFTSLLQSAVVRGKRPKAARPGTHNLRHRNSD